jgi:glutamine amidotransferase
MAHVRAATGTPVQNTNCHPFAWRNWLFQHNGSVPSFDRLKRDLLFDVDPALFPDIEGSTDSEILFFLALTFGLEKDPLIALQRTVQRVEHALLEAGILEPLTFSVAASDGQRIFAVRHATDGNAPTIYCSRHFHALRSLHGGYLVLPEDAIVVVSEPLDELTEHWDAVPPSSFVTVHDGVATVTPFVVGDLASTGQG